jgi:hypothetical protein
MDEDQDQQKWLCESEGEGNNREGKGSGIGIELSRTSQLMFREHETVHEREICILREFWQIGERNKLISVQGHCSL